MKVIVFDLDDTLYEEITYVKSGFMAVANDLQDCYGMGNTAIFQSMWTRLSEGRGQIFDDVLKGMGCYSKSAVKRCLAVYRKHVPDIRLDRSAEQCLHEFRNQPLYIVTDGNKLVQHNKLLALGLYQQVKKCYITHRYGVANSKPSPYCFLKISERERVAPQDIVYIGDNPSKDFVGIKPLGFQTIRIMKGNHNDLEMPESHEADYRISSLDQLSEVVNGQKNVNIGVNRLVKN